MPGNRHFALFRPLEWIFLAVAVGCLGWFGWSSYLIHERQDQANEQVEHMLSDVPTHRDMNLPPPPREDFIGRLEIPRLGISAAVQASDGDNVPDYAVGYL